MFRNRRTTARMNNFNTGGPIKKDRLWSGPARTVSVDEVSAPVDPAA